MMGTKRRKTQKGILAFSRHGGDHSHKDQNDVGRAINNNHGRCQMYPNGQACGGLTSGFRDGVLGIISGLHPSTTFWNFVEARRLPFSGSVSGPG